MRRLLALAAVAAAALAATTAAHGSTWCGAASTADDLHPVVPGPSLHFVYAIPSDGADRLSQWGTTMQTDAETIDAWWRGQDATRTPRFDTTALSCGAQLDITEVRLPSSSADLTPSGTRFGRILGGLVAAGLDAPFEIYVVYFDGPDDGSQICGEGGTNDPTRGGAYAVVFTGGCGPEPTAVTAAHELTHALGAVTAPAPHDCPPPDDGHVCDTNRDLMYPFVDGSPLTDLTLDVGRDDYYGASGVGFDVRQSIFLRHLDQPQVPLTVALSGTGTVTSDVPGVSCTASCTTTWDGGGPAIDLTADPAPGMRFVHWTGGCSGETDCQVTLGAATSVSALFAPLSYRLAIAVRGGGGVLPTGLASVCQRRCALDVPSYQPVSLRAIALPGWRLGRWAGACHGTKLRCTVPMTAATSATAIFVKKPKR